MAFKTINTKHTTFKTTRLLGILSLSLGLGACEMAETEAPPPTLDTTQIANLIPNRKQDKASWASDIARIYDTLGIYKGSQNICTTIAIIDQESNFVADPAVPNLGETSLAALNDKLESKLGKTMAGVFKKMLATKPDPNHNFIKQIKAVKTERELDELFRKMFAYFSQNYKMSAVTDTAKLLGAGIDEKLNPITTLGSMQVHIDYAKKNRRTNMTNDELRADLYEQYGGLYYGIHRLMLYQANYDKPIYRFADYNSGMYSSRNAAFQSQLATISGKKLTLDGDLLLWDGDNPKQAKSNTETAILSLGLPNLTERQIRQDLKKEKTQSFELTATYQAVKEQYGKKTGKYPDYAIMPQVVISSVKLSSDKNTNWFATRVQKRYDSCMAIATKNGYVM